MSEEITLVMDVKQNRPGCVLLQAAYGCGDNNGFLQALFDPDVWLLAPTPDMAKITGTMDQWKGFAKVHGKKAIPRVT